MYRFAGSPTGMAGAANGQGSAATFNGPEFGNFDSQGNLFITDSSGNAIRRIDPMGNVTLVAGVPGATGSNDGPAAMATFNYPQGIAVGPDGTLYVAETTGETVRQIGTDGTVTTLAGASLQNGSNDGAGTMARFNQPVAIVIDSSGNLFVADANNHDIRKIDPSANVTTFAGSPNTLVHQDGMGTSAGFEYPSGLTIDSEDNLYVADMGDNTIRKIDPSGNVTTVAGVAGQSGSNDGPALSAEFDFPTCLAVDANGVLYISDTNNYTIRKLDTSGTVSTLVGVAGTNAIQTGALPGLISNVYGISVSPSGEVFPLSANQVFVVGTQPPFSG